MSGDPTVFVVDDDLQAAKSVCALVKSMGVVAVSYSSGEEFLAAYVKGTPGCLVTDMRMLGMSGLELQEELKRREILLPVIVLTAYARTSLTVQAMQAGAVTLLEKPYLDDDLWDAVRKALAADVSARQEHERRLSLRSRIAELTTSQRFVLDLMVAGKPNKAIANALNVSLRTVENRRREIFDRMGAGSVAELVRMIIDADLSDASDQS